MPIFSRRIIQKILNESRIFLPEEHTASHIKKLNKQDNSSIATVWEIAILNALSKIGKVAHEIKFQGKKPDIYFQSSNMASFVADITSISDESYDKENPIKYFNECLSIFFKKEGLTIKGLEINFGNKIIGNYGDQKIKISLPKKNHIHRFIKDEFYRIRASIKSSPAQGFEEKIKRDNISLTIRYNPKNPYFTSGYACYTASYSLKKNPLYNRLKDKANQLRGTEYEGIMGVFICDGGCEILNNNYNSMGISQHSIIAEIFRSNTTLSFVIIFSLEERYGLFGEKPTKQIQMQYYQNDKAKFPVNSIFSNQLKTIRNHFPLPESMPVNSKTYMKSRKHNGLSHYGGFSTNMTDEIQISSRMLTELLAGVLKYEEFDSAHKQGDINQRNMIKDFFFNQFQKGNIIDDISIEKCPEQDDDWLKFKFDSSNGAISKYK